MKESLLGHPEKGLLFIVSGPAGSGKTTLIEKLEKEFSSVAASVSFTTRKPRPGEVEGIHYHFISESEFKKKIDHGDFLEYVKLYDDYYGTSLSWTREKQKLGKQVILVIDTQGALQIKEKVKGIFIFVNPPSLEALEKRLLKRRTENSDNIKKRMERAIFELEDAKYYDYQLVNDNIEMAYQIFRSIFIAEGHRII